MTTTTAQRMRDWQGPAVLSFGFRPFFLGAGLWAAMAMALWVPMLTGRLSLPTAFDPVGWHAHEFLFGYLGAVIAGFLLTAVPNWTGRLPITGWPLAGLWTLWLAGRLAVAFSALLSPLVVALADLALPVVLGAVIAREIVAGRNWRNLVVLAMLAGFAAGNAQVHWEAAQGAPVAQGTGMRLGIAAALLLVAVIGGRIVPSFTRNWLVRREPGRLPVPQMQRLDRLALGVLVATLALWVMVPHHAATGIALAITGAMHLIRLARWAGDRTLAEPLVWVLHLAYALLPLGALVLATETLVPGTFGAGAALHPWMAGALGLMTLAVMTRATLGHTGQPLRAGARTMVIYLALIASVLARLAAGLWPWQADIWHLVAGSAWIAGFGGFAVLYGGLLLRPRQRQG